MRRQEYRTWQAGTVDDLAPHVGIARACALVGRSRATHHRQAHPAPRVHGPWPRPHHRGELSEAERVGVLAVLNSVAYADMAVAQVWARELDEGRYHCSQSTMYRILAEAGQNGERRRQATHPPKVVPELVAEAPNEVWSWDITKMRGPSKGCWYHAYVILDIFSRYILGWRIESVEDGLLATDLIAEIIAEQDTPPAYLHADRGAAMTSKPLASLLVDLDVTRSHNRPRTSNDNPFSESQFKTMKYVPDYPVRFDSITHARAWMSEFVPWYNHEHRHSGIGLHTPASVHYGTADDVRDRRQATLDAAYAAHPERFTRRPRAPRLPERVTINDPTKRTHNREPQKA
ncbi:MAG: IS3 family transposase [Georgenia sp.]